PFDYPRDAGFADEHVVRLFGEHESRRARQRIERALRERQQLRLAVAVGEHREHEEIQPVLDRFVEGVENAWLIAIPALASQKFLCLVAAVPAEIRMQQIHHRPQMTAFLDVHLKQVSEIVQTRAPLAEPALLLDARRLSIALSHDEAAKLIAEFAGPFLPDRLAGQGAESDAPVVNRIGQKDAPPVFWKLHVLEVRPSGWIDAHRRPNVDLVVVLEPLRPHVLPPLDVLRLPVFKRALETFITGKPNVVGDFLGRNHAYISEIADCRLLI